MSFIHSSSQLATLSTCGGPLGGTTQGGWQPPLVMLLYTAGLVKTSGEPAGSTACSCVRAYIGEAKRWLETRLKEHLNSGVTTKTDCKWMRQETHNNWWHYTAHANIMHMVRPSHSFPLFSSKLIWCTVPYKVIGHLHGCLIYWIDSRLNRLQHQALACKSGICPHPI